MTTIAHPLAATDEIVLPTQAGPVRSAASPPPVAVELEDPQVHGPDYVHTHRRSCWWNLTECRWECGRT